jgi:asparagine synthase (glutamine-hydrolysing)
MCGIVGIAHVADRVEQSVADAALETLSRRGPDALGQWQGSGCWFGHRRLSIVDLSESGLQPMQYGTYTITFNGMIYNYRQIRSELQRLGHQFISDTDTEVILVGWSEWKEALLPRLDGMFSFAIWDSDCEELILARDRFGEKPLLWRPWQGGIAFGSRLDTIECLTQKAELSDDALRWLLSLRYIPEPHSAYVDVKKLRPGHFLRSRAGHIQEIAWYQLGPSQDVIDLSPSDQSDILRSCISTATQNRLIADVPIAAFLSGGIDSTIIAAMACQYVSLSTFTVGFTFGNSGIFDERKIAERTARYLNTDHHSLGFDVNDCLSSVDALLNVALDEPFADISALPTMMVAQHMREHAIVALSGDGADEIFGGYRKYQGERFAATWSDIPSTVRSVISGLLACIPANRRHRLGEWIRKAQRFVKAASLPECERHAAWMRLLAGSEVTGLLRRHNKGSDLTRAVEDLVAAVDVPDSIDHLSAPLFRDVAILLPSDMLYKVDRAAMHHGLEVRCPFLDHNVVEAAFAIDGKNKISKFVGKKILREAFRDDLPEHVFREQKRGFELPLNEWLAGPLSDRVNHALDEGYLESLGFLTPKIGKKWQQDMHNGDAGRAELIWTLISLQAWQSRVQPSI